MENKHTLQELQTRQAMPLNLKIALTKQRIRDWVNYWGEHGVVISFSGDKDSTVLLDIARKMYPNLKAVFVDTGLEYPEIVKFVKSFDNVDIIKPKMSFFDVVNKYGYPMISKEVSECVYGARRFLQTVQDKMHVEYNKGLTNGDIDEIPVTDRQIPYAYYLDKLVGKGTHQISIGGASQIPV